MTNTPKLWKDMTDAEKGALLLAYLEGSCVESHDGGKWFTPSPPQWRDAHAYRIKPKAPKFEAYTAKHSIWRFRDGGFASGTPHAPDDADPSFIANITHTYTITDGIVTACDTTIYKNEGTN